MSQDDAYELGREDAVAVSQGEIEAPRYQNNPVYMRGFEEQSDEIAAEQGDDSIHRDPAHDYDDDSHEEVYDDDGMWEGKNIEEADGAKGVTYWPFVGGKIDKEDIQMAKDTLSDYRKRYDAINDGGVVDREERGRIEGDLDKVEKIVRTMSKRHSKKDFDKANKAWSSLDDSLRTAFGKHERALKKKRRDIGDADLARMDRESERERQADRNRNDRYRAQRQQEKEKLDRQYGSSGRDDYHRVNPGFAGTGNMGYGESLNRAKISKSELAQIIKEELKNILK
jgi:hypothetical protein